MEKQEVVADLITVAEVTFRSAQKIALDTIHEAVFKFPEDSGATGFIDQDGYGGGFQFFLGDSRQYGNQVAYAALIADDWVVEAMKDLERSVIYVVTGVAVRTLTEREINDFSFV